LAKQKPHRRVGSGVRQIYLNESEPDCRAAQPQRVVKQQIQIRITIHVGTLSRRAGGSNSILGWAGLPPLRRLPRRHATLALDLSPTPDLDLSAANLPPETRLSLGSAVIEVTSPPHTGCMKFKARYGVDALNFVNSPTGKQLNLRGINAKVFRPGMIGVGDVAKKL
jgi:hypothetical protein